MVGGWSDKTKVILNSTQFKLKLELSLAIQLKGSQLSKIICLIYRVFINENNNVCIYYSVKNVTYKIRCDTCQIVPEAGPI